jgi:hypothetical protein
MRRMIVVVILAGCLAHAPGRAAIADFQDVPAAEQHVGEGIPKAATFQDLASIFGRGDGHVVVLDLEDFKVVARHSADQGATFDPAILLAGGAGRPDGEFFRAAQGADGSVYVAMAIVDPLGGIGLQVARTVDMGQTWSTPIDIIRHGNPLHDIVAARQRFSVAAGPAGRAAVLFAHDNGGGFYVVSTVDFGQTWTTPVRVDAAAGAAPSAPYYPIDLAIAPNGYVHVAYAQNRPGTRLMYTRSTDGGVSFEADRAINVATGAPRSPDVEIGADGGVLIAYSAGSNVVVLRSSNAGVSFASTTLFDLDNNTYRAPVIRAADGTAEVIVACPSLPSSAVTLPSEGPLRVWRSISHGASFGSAITIASQAYRGDTFSTVATAVQRTPSGVWAVGWMDTQADDYAYAMADVKVSVSLNGGAAWGTATQVQSGSPGDGARSLGPEGMAASSNDDLVFAWMDGREDNARSRAIRLNRAPASALAFGADWRLGDDTSLVNAEMIDPDVAGDGVSRVYVAFGAVGAGPFPAIYVAASSDSGHSFSAPVLAGSAPGGALIEKLPKVLARPDGHVYVLYQTETAFGARTLNVNRSSDYGATWSATPVSVGAMAAPCPPTVLCGDPSLEDPQIALGPPGRVYVTWTDGSSIMLARSTDDGAHFTTDDVDGDPLSSSMYLSALCVRGDQVVVAFVGYDPDWGGIYPFATVSPDGGVNWGARTALSSSLNEANYFGGLTCAADSNGEVLVAWSALASYERIFFSRWDGVAWDGAYELTAPPDEDLYGPIALITSASHLVITYGTSSDKMYSSRSIDGGHTFIDYQRLDDAVPLPDAYSYGPFAATDGQGNIWAGWDDFSSGRQNALAMRHSSDNGATWGPAYRLNRNEPQGGHYHFGFWMNSHLAALPGVGFAAYPAQRTTRREEIFVNAFEPGDFDRDFAPSAFDCNDGDPGARAIPVEATALTVTHAAGATLSWASQSATAGSGTTYDIVTGSLSELRADASYARTACLASRVAAATYADTRGGPVSDDAYYYLLRARNSCGAGSFGDGSGVPNPRNGLDASTLCP